MDIHFDVPFNTLFKAAKDWHTPSGIVIPHRAYKKYLRSDLADIFKSQGIEDPFLEEREIVAQIFPFKINAHVIDQIDWSSYQNDPIFQLTFPQPDMLLPNEIEHMKSLKRSGASRETIAAYISDIRSAKNPAPANQSANRPLLEDEHEASTIPCDGLQHKYKQIVLMFHKNAQTCHAYCTYCFRFNQFTGKDKFLEPDENRLHQYLKQHTEITDVLMTGGDPATMKVDVWKRTLEPLLSPEFAHIKTIRIGTKALTYHPYRFLTDPDADELIALFKRMKQAGKHIRGHKRSRKTPYRRRRLCYSYASANHETY
jgi:L-lysine 2,3-aminomutase